MVIEQTEMKIRSLQLKTKHVVDWAGGGGGGGYNHVRLSSSFTAKSVSCIHEASVKRSEGNKRLPGFSQFTDSTNGRQKQTKSCYLYGALGLT